MGKWLRMSCAWVLAWGLAAMQAVAGEVVGLDVDAREVSRGLLTARLVMPVQPGPLTLLYPKWIPGNHRPSGTATSLSGLAFSAGGKPLAWQRDPVDMFAFHLEVPAGVTALQVSMAERSRRNGRAMRAGTSATGPKPASVPSSA